MALMVLGAVRLRTWARPERAIGWIQHRQVGTGRTCQGWVCQGTAWEARVVVGQVRFLTRARPSGYWRGEARRDMARHGWERNGAAGRGAVWQVLGGALDGRRWGSTPHRGAARKRLWFGAVRLGMAGQGVAGHHMDGRSDGRRRGSTPLPSTARKGSWFSADRKGAFRRVRAGQGMDRHGEAWERYWQTPGFKSPERTTAKAVQARNTTVAPD